MNKLKIFTVILILQIIAVNHLYSQIMIDKNTIQRTKDILTGKHGSSQAYRVNKGVERAAALWRESDGTAEDFVQFCADNFQGDEAKVESLFKRIEYYNEILYGHFTEMTLGLRQYLDLDWGEIQPIDLKMGGYDPSAHLTEDLFGNKYGFLIALNFPNHSLDEKSALGPAWNRKEWAYSRLGRSFITRIPPELNLKLTETLSEADNYISEYNIIMNTLVDDEFNTYFPTGMKLISHWGLRDELKSQYANSDGLKKQKMIYEVMKRIISQDIPKNIINSSEYQWNPYKNKLYKNGKETEFKSEPNTRFEKWLNVFKIIKETDKYYPPELSTQILRSFEAEREIKEKDAEIMFDEILSSAQAKEVAEIIRKKLGRELEPFDIWFTGFKSRGKIDEAELDKITKAKYPTPEAFEQDIKNILIKLGFSTENADYISDKITVDASRGAGHAFGSAMRKFKAHLRTRVGKDGMNYKGYNIAIHELGHNVEQTLTLYKMDYYTLNGVPNTSFTEAFAFLFQDRDLELLGIKNENPQAEDYRILDNFWSTYEIAGVSLLDMKVWNWLYKNPNATAEELKKSVSNIAKEIWNKYYTPVFGKKDETILAIYSHMIDNPIYLPNYAIGHIIEFQIEEFLKGKVLGEEMPRMCASGNITPSQWMINAVGSGLSAKPMLESVEKVLKKNK